MTQQKLIIEDEKVAIEIKFTPAWRQSIKAGNGLTPRGGKVRGG
jgi:hypothetical protein